MQTGAGGAGAGGMSGKQFPQRTPVDMALHTLSHGGDRSSSPSQLEPRSGRLGRTRWNEMKVS